MSQYNPIFDRWLYLGLCGTYLGVTLGAYAGGVASLFLGKGKLATELSEQLSTFAPKDSPSPDHTTGSTSRGSAKIADGLELAISQQTQFA